MLHLDRIIIVFQSFSIEPRELLAWELTHVEDEWRLMEPLSNPVSCKLAVDRESFLLCEITSSNLRSADRLGEV